MYRKMMGAQVSAISERRADTVKPATNANPEYFRTLFLQLSPSRGGRRKGIVEMKNNPTAPGKRPRKSENLAAPGSVATSPVKLVVSGEFAVAQPYVWKSQKLRVAQPIQMT
jgi:hypothetical protein